MNFEITYWGQQAAVVVSKVTFPRGKPTVANESVYADMMNYFPHDIEAKVVGSPKWHYQAKRLKAAAVAQVKAEPVIVKADPVVVNVEPVIVKPVVVEMPKTEPTVPAPVDPAMATDVDVAPVTPTVVVPPIANEVDVVEDISNLTLEEQISKLASDCPADVVTQIADELVSGSATQDSIMALAGVKARVAKRILKLVGG